MRVRLTPIALLGLVIVPTLQQHASPRRQGVGTVRFATSCSASVQPLFNRSVALLHSFAFSQATDGFHAVLRVDQRCAMAWWGLALSAWGNPFAYSIS